MALASLTLSAPCRMADGLGKPSALRWRKLATRATGYFGALDADADLPITRLGKGRSQQLSAVAPAGSHPNPSPCLSPAWDSPAVDVRAFAPRYDRSQLIWLLVKWRCKTAPITAPAAICCLQHGVRLLARQSRPLLRSASCSMACA